MPCIQCCGVNKMITTENRLNISTVPVAYIKCKWQMRHFWRSIMGYKNSPIFTPWMSSSKSISWLVQSYLPSDVVRACIKYNLSKLIEALILYNCTSRWSCMYIIMSVHYLPKGRDQIKRWTWDQTKRWTKN